MLTFSMRLSIVGWEKQSLLRTEQQKKWRNNMKFLRYLLPAAALAVSFSATSAFAAYPAPATDSFHIGTDQRDFEAVQEFVNSKRTIPLEEKDCNLSISGDIRFAWAHIVENLNHHRLRGHNGFACENPVNGEVSFNDEDPDCLPFSTSAFAVEFNLYFDYVCDRSWGVAWLQFEEDAGVQPSDKFNTQDRQGLFGSGTFGCLALRKAYMGYNICADGCSRFDVELGRRPLYTVFDSRIQFQANADGLLLNYARYLDCWGDFYVKAMGFVVDERVNHYAYIVETGLLDIGQCGLDLRYSFTDWKSLLRHDQNRAHVNDPHGAKFRISQFTASYGFNADYLCMPAKIYGAFLVNHTPSRSFNVPSAPDDRRGSQRLKSSEKYAWYIGMIVGEVCREGDWSFDFNYQYVQALAIPDVDVSGIGRSGSNLLGGTTTANGLGFTNYKGWRFEGLYALTDNLSLDTIFEFSSQIKSIVGKHSYSKFEIQAIYAF